MYLLHATIRASHGQGDELNNILLEAAQVVAQIPECRMYLVGKATHDADLVHITEVWNTKQDHDLSLQTEAVRAVISKAMPIVEGPPDTGNELELVGGFGLMPLAAPRENIVF